MDDGIGAGGSRRLLGLLREVMAGSGAAQDRLDLTVRAIAGSMEAEVCSVYIRRAGDILELYATEGLFAEAVHRTRLRLGEGLVGVIAATARPLSLDDAQSHPAFAYRPETGEEIYHSLMGVPILRAGIVTGVLVVQNRSRRRYTEEEIEALQTVAMVLAELVAGGELINLDEQHPVEGIATLPHRLDGIKLNGGIAMGTAVRHRTGIVIREIVAEDPEAELTRLDQAIVAMHLSLDRLLAASDIAAGGEHRDILETYRMFAEDRGWLGRIREAVHSGLTAEAAVQKVRDETRLRMKQINDPYIRERLSDLEDLANRLQLHLVGGETGPESLPDDAVLIAHSMGPAELLDYDRRKLRALVLEEGSPAAHVAVVARALNIPVVSHAIGALAQIEPGDIVVVDGENAQVMIRPGEDIIQAVEVRLEARRHQEAVYETIRDLPARTRDGISISLNINAGLLIDLPELAATNADGIGLYRTELPFMMRNSFPSVEDQASLYARIMDNAEGKPVVFRTLDIGGDKLLPYLPANKEENPALGWRAIRIALDRPAMLRHQLRALIIGANGRPFSVMFPMVAELDEFLRAKRILSLEISRAKSRGLKLPSRLSVGTMIEVPALIFQIQQLCAEVDFISIGSNDLIQFLFARDRGNAKLANRYDSLSAPLLNCFATLVRATRARDIPLSLCGEMAGHPLDAMALIGLGLRSLSMSPSSIGPVKAMVRSLDMRPLEKYVASLFDRPDSSLRDKLRAYAADHNIVI